MDITDYMHQTRKTAVYGSGVNTKQEQILYCMLGLVGETGEIAEKLKKKLRGGGKLEEFIDDPIIAKELGDVAWYWARLCDELNWDTSAVLEMNVAKLLSRLKRDKIHGEGDDR